MTAPTPLFTKAWPWCSERDLTASKQPLENQRSLTQLPSKCLSKASWHPSCETAKMPLLIGYCFSNCHCEISNEQHNYLFHRTASVVQPGSEYKHFSDSSVCNFCFQIIDWRKHNCNACRVGNHTDFYIGEGRLRGTLSLCLISDQQVNSKNLQGSQEHKMCWKQ